MIFSLNLVFGDQQNHDELTTLLILFWPHKNSLFLSLALRGFAPMCGCTSLAGECVEGYATEMVVVGTPRARNRTWSFPNGVRGTPSHHPKCSQLYRNLWLTWDPPF